MIKGSVCIQKFDAETGECTFELNKANMYFPQFFQETLKAIKHRLYGNMLNELSVLPLVEAQGVTNLGNLTTTALTTDIIDGPTDQFTFNRLFLSNNTDDVLEDEYGLEKHVVAGASLYKSYSGSSPIRGTLNITESNFNLTTRTAKFVVDFATNVANGTFQSVCLASQKTHNQSTTDSDMMDFTDAVTVVQRALMVPATEIKFSHPLASLNTYAWRLFDSPNAPEGYKLAIRLGGATGLNYCYVNLATGEYTALTEIKNASGASFGTIYNYEDVDVENGYLYFCRHATTGYGLYRWALSNLSANAVSLALFNITEATQTWQGGFVVLGSKIYSRGISSSIDPVTGVEYADHIHVKELSAPNVIIDRISLTEYLNQLDGESGYARANLTQHVSARMMKDSVRGKITCVLYSSATSPSYNLMHRVIFIESDAVEGVTELMYSVQKHYSINLSNTNYPFIFIINSDVYITTNSSSVGPFLSFGKVVPRCKMSRVLLPAPVTKINTETMKVTYNLTIPDESIMLLGLLGTT